jgi:hypothetical protein
LRPWHERRPRHRVGLDLVEPEELRPHVEPVGQPRRSRHFKRIALAVVARTDVGRYRLLIIERRESEPSLLDRRHARAVAHRDDAGDGLTSIARQRLDQPNPDPLDIEAPDPSRLDRNIGAGLPVEHFARGRPQADLAQRLTDIDDDYARHAFPTSFERI